MTTSGNSNRSVRRGRIRPRERTYSNLPSSNSQHRHNLQRQNDSREKRQKQQGRSSLNRSRRAAATTGIILFTLGLMSVYISSTSSSTATSSHRSLRSKIVDTLRRNLRPGIADSNVDRDDQPLLKHFFVPPPTEYIDDALDVQPPYDPLLGHQLFVQSTLLASANLNDMLPCTFYPDPSMSSASILSDYFTGPFYRCADPEVGYGWDSTKNAVLDYDQFVRNPQDNSDVALYGTFQSFVNFDFDSEAVVQAMAVKEPYDSAVRQDTDAVTIWDGDGITELITVGMHVMPRDMTGCPGCTTKQKVDKQKSLQPDVAFYANAMEVMRRSYGAGRVRFLVSSEDMEWARNEPLFAEGYDVMFIEDVAQQPIWKEAPDGEEDPQVDPNLSFVRDFAFLQKCQHMIVSVDTFSWWAAWLGAHQTGGSVLYYDDYKRILGIDDSYFPPKWVRISSIPDEADKIMLDASSSSAPTPYTKAITMTQMMEKIKKTRMDLYGPPPEAATAAPASEYEPSLDNQEEEAQTTSPPNAHDEDSPAHPFDGISVAYPGEDEEDAQDDTDEIADDIEYASDAQEATPSLAETLATDESSTATEEEIVDIQTERREAETTEEAQGIAPKEENSRR